MTLSTRCLLVVVLSLTASLPGAPARADLPGIRLDDACLEKVWNPSDEKLAGQPGWNDDRHRLSFAPDGPGGKTALRIETAEGRPSGTTSYRKRLDVAMTRRARVARIRGEFFIPEGTRFNPGGAKMPLGVWGGDPEVKRICNAGGCPPELQTGFSVRLTRYLTEKDSPGAQGPRLYSYHLNRDGRRTLASKSHARAKKGYEEIEFGQGFGMDVDFPVGEWFTLTMDVALNEVTPEAIFLDGFIDLYMHDADGALLGTVSADRLMFRIDPDWHVFGPNLSDLWGGDQTAPRRIPVMDTVVYSRGYEFFLLGEDRALKDCVAPRS